MAKDRETLNLEYWDEILAEQGLPANLPSTRKELEKAGYVAKSLESLRRKTLKLQEGLDNEIVFENQHPSAQTLGNTGLPPCIRVRNGRDGS